MRHLFITLLLGIIFSSAYAQPLRYKIKLINAEGELIKEFNGRADSLKFQKIVNSEYKKVVKRGYVLASVTISETDSLQKAIILKQKAYLWGKFNINFVPEALLSRVGYHKNQFDNKLVNTKVLGDLMIKIIEESDKTGYPFALVRLDSVVISKEKISAILMYSSGQKIKYGALELENEFIKSKYLESYLEIKENTTFNSIKINEISKKINNLSYAKIKSLPQIRFENKSCKVALKVIPVKANKVDAMIGLAPNQIDNSKLLATGYINLDLQNLFRSGKSLTFNWRQFGVQSQMLKAMYNHTNLFRSVINLKGEIDLFKQDTSFVNRNFYINIGYDAANYTINFTSSFISSRLLSITNSTGINNLDLIDFNGQYYGVSFVKNELDNTINPRKGWSLSTMMNLGAKNILNTSFVPSKVYDSLKIQSLQGNFQLASDIAIPINKLFIAYSKIQLGSVITNGELFNNDLIRLGGVNSIRGFNELEIYSSTYTLVQVEGRLLLGESSRLFGFVDWAYSENKVANNNDTFLGIGAGLLLDTSSGAFQLVYAVGKSSKQSLSLAESKIHIGYVARF